jgi:hypothetical protein
MTVQAATRAAKQQQQAPAFSAAAQHGCVCRSRQNQLLLGRLQHLLLQLGVWLESGWVLTLLLILKAQ